LRYAFDTTRDDETRRLLMLQGASFLPLFRGAMHGRGKVGDAKIDHLHAPDQQKECDVADVFAEVSKNRPAAASMAFGYLKSHPDGGRKLIDAGRLLVFLKGTDSHDYKFS